MKNIKSQVSCIIIKQETNLLKPSNVEKMNIQNVKKDTNTNWNRNYYIKIKWSFEMMEKKKDVHVNLSQIHPWLFGPFYEYGGDDNTFILTEL